MNTLEYLIVQESSVILKASANFKSVRYRVSESKLDLGKYHVEIIVEVFDLDDLHSLAKRQEAEEALLSELTSLFQIDYNLQSIAFWARIDSLTAFIWKKTLIEPNR